MGGYVYLITDIDETIYKIGVTRNLNNKRLKSLQTGNHAKLKMIQSFFCEFPFRLESLVHKHYSNFREEGEWFKLSKDDADSFLEICRQYNDYIRALSENPFFMKNIH